MNTYTIKKVDNINLVVIQYLFLYFVQFSETMVAMEHVEFARSLAPFLMIYLLICNGNFGALATQGEQKHCYNHI